MSKETRIAGVVVALIAAAGLVHADGLRFAARLSGAQVFPPPGAPGLLEGGSVQIAFAEDFSSARVRVALEGADNVVAMHFHCGLPGQPGPVAAGLINPGGFMLEDGVAEGVLTNDDVIGANCSSVVGRPVQNLVALAFLMREGLSYLNVHTTDNPPGEIRGQLLPTRRPPRGAGDDDDDDDAGGHGPRGLIGSAFEGGTQNGTLSLSLR